LLLALQVPCFSLPVESAWLDALTLIVFGQAAAKVPCSLKDIIYKDPKVVLTGVLVKPSFRRFEEMIL